LPYLHAETFRFSLPFVPVRAQVLHLLDVSKQKFLYFARFLVLSTQVLYLDLQPLYFPPHYRRRIGRVQIGRREGAHEWMNVRNSELIRHGQSMPKDGLQTVNGMAWPFPCAKRAYPCPASPVPVAPVPEAKDMRLGFGLVAFGRAVSTAE
jgi:hypothetical protein